MRNNRVKEIEEEDEKNYQSLVMKNKTRGSLKK